MRRGSDWATSYNYSVEFIGRRTVYNASFKQVSGLKARGSVQNIKEGGKNDRPHTHVTGIEYDPIVLSRGITYEMDLINLFSNQFDPSLGLTHHWNGIADGNLFTLKIKKRDRAGNVLREMELRRCQVIGYEESDNDALSSEILIESITVDFDEVWMEGYQNGQSLAFRDMLARLGSTGNYF